MLMQEVKINNVKKPISGLMMGTDYFSPDIIDTVAENMENFIKIGGNTLDTAHIYLGGKSEEAIGIWMEENKRRDDIMILTKGGHPNHNGPTVNKKDIDEELKISLERLRTDYVELYALHRDDPTVHVGEILEILNEHVEAGKIGAFGGSNWTTERLQEANDYAKNNGLIGFSFVIEVQHLCNGFFCILEVLLFQSAENRVGVFCNLFDGKHILYLFLCYSVL